VLFAGTVESELWMWKMPAGDSKIFTAHGEKVESAQLLPDGENVLPKTHKKCNQKSRLKKRMFL